MNLFKYMIAALIGGGVAYASKKKYAKGGTTAKKSPDYISPKRIAEIIIKEGGKEVVYANGEFLSGAYKFGKGGKIEDDYKYVKKENVVKAILNNGKEIKPINGFWVKKGKPKKKMAQGGSVKRTGVASKKVNIPRKIKYFHDAPNRSTALMKALSSVTGKDWLRPVMQYIAVGDGYLVATNGHVLAAIRDESTDGSSVYLECHKKKCDNEDEIGQMKYPLWEPLVNVYSETFAEFKTVDLFRTISEKINQYDTRKVKMLSIKIDFDGKEVTYDMVRLKGLLKLALQLGWDSITFSSSGDASTVATLIRWAEDSNRGTLLIMPLRPEVASDSETFVAEYTKGKGLTSIKVNARPQLKRGGKTSKDVVVDREIKFSE